MSQPVKVILPTPLRPYAGNADAVEVQAGTVRDALKALTAQHSGLRRHLFDDAGALRNYVNVYVNDEDIRYLQKDATPLKAGDTISIVPSIAGGSVTVMERVSRSKRDRLSMSQVKRYSRHLILPEVGVEGQVTLLNASALIVGAGGLGAPLAQYLAAAGVGRLGLVDFDVVDPSNLQRQVIYGTQDVGRPKLEAAKRRIEAINADVEVRTHETRLTSENALDILRDYDVVVDGTDNFPTRYLVNDACVLLGKPNVYGSIFRWEGQASVFWAEKGPCYRCLYAEPPPPGLVPSCAEGGVFGVLPGIVGTIQATEAIKILLGTGDPLVGRLLLFDAMRMRFRELKLRKDPACPVCGPDATIKEPIDYEAWCGVPAAGAGLAGEFVITPEALKAKLDRGEPVVLVDVREPMEWRINRIEGATLVPLATLPQKVNELSTADEIVMYCKMGSRSAQAVNFLRELGYRKVKNLAGGIDAWVERVDPSLPNY
ncbi:MAG TPA: molybdopterin-synthase adenylyltransferase MoeB [Thermoplasmata archaeon]|nr:molybdopterin-synthase adenylyltransferase MoeB [Thermoplasmata archaeon]